MSVWLRIYYVLLNMPLSLLVKSNSVPTKPVLELGIDVSRPIVYILPYTSQVDLLTLRSQSLLCNLPDPLKPFNIGGIDFPRYIFIDNKSHVYTSYMLKKEYIKLLHEYLNLNRNNLDIDIQLVLVSVIFGNNPWRNKKNFSSLLVRILNTIKKIYDIICLGRNSFVYFLTALSLRQIAIEHGIDKITIEKLIRVAHIYIIRQRLAALGPILPTRNTLFNRILTSKTINCTIEDEIHNKHLYYKDARQNVILLIREIAANFSYRAIRFTNRILTLIWNCLYQRINVYNIKYIRKLAYNGYKIVYIPCHRSHMDYLLISYVLYHHGLALPHIAAGINLNFWPIGSFFRRLGAFFIRRNFKVNKLYSTVLREYLRELFNRGNSVEYFIEGKRSRTGRLLNPRTGILSITIQSILRFNVRPVAFVPIYISYESIIEVNTYIKELHGVTKKKESILQILQSIYKLRNFGQVYVSFGEPLLFMKWLNVHVPEWHKCINLIQITRPIWLIPTVNTVATDLMIRINNACVINAMNLCSTALLASHKYSLTRYQLTEQLKCYINFMRNVPYSNNTILPLTKVSELIDHLLQINRLKIKKGEDNMCDIISISHEQVLLMTYYRNNIAHLLVLPSLIATIIIRYNHLSRLKLIFQIKILYPILKAELFLRWNYTEIIPELNKLINEFLRQKLINIKDNELLINPFFYFKLELLAAGVRETLQRYAVTFWLLNTNPFINRNMLVNKSYTLAQQLILVHGINTLEFFDKSVFSTLTLILRDQGYIKNHTNVNPKQITKIYQIIIKLIDSNIFSTIETIGY